MKKFLILTGLILSATTSCSRVNPLETEIVIEKDKTENWEANITYSLFSSPDADINESCTALNDEIRKLIGSLQDSLKINADKLFASLKKDGIDRPAWKYQLTVKDSVFMATDKYISIRFNTYHFAGGAHGMTKLYVFNYDVKNRKMLSNDGIFDKTKHAEIDKKLKEHFQNPSNCLTETPTFDKVSVVNIAPASICFTYEHYLLGPYACGIYESTIPRDELKNILLPKNL